MKPTIEIKLDVAALNALFPEGSEARLNLQNGVMANFAYKQFKMKADEDVKEIIDQASKRVREEAEKQLSDMFRFQWGIATLLDSARPKVAEAVRNEVNSMMHTETYKHMDTIKKMMDDAAARIPNLVQKLAVEEIEKKIRAEIQDKLKAIKL